MSHKPTEAYNQLKQLLSEKVLCVDGATGTEIQKYKLTEEDFRGELFKEHKIDLDGNNDILSLTRPDILLNIHLSYLSAGSDIIETCTFNSTRISQSHYGTSDYVPQMVKSAVKIARNAIKKFKKENPNCGPKFVAGSIGPTVTNLSINSKGEDSTTRPYYFEQVLESYTEQVRALYEAGVDIFQIETITDPLNCKAALVAIYELEQELKVKFPVFISATIFNNGLLSGQSIEAFVTTIKPYNPLVVGLNCSWGCTEMRKYIKNLSEISPFYSICYPNAGLPDVWGKYTEKPETTANHLKEFAESGFVNIVGGCCGTSPEHIKQIANKMKGITPRVPPKIEYKFEACGLETLKITEESPFVNIGERCNVMGSSIFAKKVRGKKLMEMIAVARRQVENGAQIIDINLDDSMLDSKVEMKKFLLALAMERDVAKVPFMIDSSNFEVIIEALKVIQGKPVVNSIHLSGGEEEFIKHAKIIKKFGAAVVVMTTDEEGQATTRERKFQIAKRSYDLLTDPLIGFQPNDIIFDPCILTIGTGIKEHNQYGVEFIESIKLIKKAMPNVLISGGVSNLSFSFRRETKLRKIMHSIFLYHSINAGMDMGIVNVAHLDIYDQIEKNILKIVEEFVLNSNEGAFDALLKYLEDQKQKLEEEKQNKINSNEKGGEELKKKKQTVDQPLTKETVEKKIEYVLVKGLIKQIESLVLSANELYGDPLLVVEGPLLNGMSKVSDLFGSGKMFLPQVLKSANVMKKGFSILRPLIEESKKQNSMNIENEKEKKKRVLLATVKGDVHDIGKNIVNTILSCNNYEVIDLGIRVPADKIINTLKEQHFDVLGLSGLITPSLNEMINVIKELERNKLDIPVLIGGATTSAIHCAVKMAPHYSGSIVYILDASKCIKAVKNLLNPEVCEEYKSELKRKQQMLRDQYTNSVIAAPLRLKLEQARDNKLKIDWSIASNLPPRPNKLEQLVFENYDIEELIPYIDWKQFFVQWKMKGKYPCRFYPKVFDDKKIGKEAKKLFEDAQEILEKIKQNKEIKCKGTFALYPANSDGDDIIIWKNDENRTEELNRFHFLRQQFVHEKLSVNNKIKIQNNLSLADFVVPKELKDQYKDYIGCFVVSSGFGLESLLKEAENSENDYQKILIKAMADRLVEAFAEKLHLEIRNNYWGYEKFDKNLNITDLFKEKYQGIRPAVGYPSIPDHSEKTIIWELLDVDNTIGVNLTENMGMNPQSSVSGLILANPLSKYFSIGRIEKDQVVDYAKRKNLSLEVIEKTWLNSILAYETEN
ncbi:hypothetical protein M0813_29272 [Anaeramoeba flamelloides]|uniref:Methionine synthase n=1 Tax=Anaeramoeba flamelloides TaxID=1746091 RepID=A0ABQ8XRH1_9EUKA|nr:hypothetical protein M0813_29272 [Anaeramoeba flamelloides]